MKKSGKAEKGKERMKKEKALQNKKK